MALRNGVASFEQAALEILVHKLQRNGYVLDAQTLTVHLGKRNLLCVVVAAIIERDAEGNTVFPVVEQRDAVHAAAHYYYTIFHDF